MHATSTSHLFLFLCSPELNTLKASEIALGFFNYLHLSNENLKNEADKQSFPMCKADQKSESYLVMWA